MKQTHTGECWVLFNLGVASDYPGELRKTFNDITQLTLSVNRIKGTIIGSYS